jgi:hypothetical protein
VSTRLVLAVDALALLATVQLSRADAFSGFLAALVVGAAAYAASSRKNEDGLVRLHLGASLAIAATFSRELYWSVPLYAVLGLFAREGRERLVPYLLASTAALTGVGLLARGDTGGALLLVLAGLAGTFLVASREVLRSSRFGLSTRMAFVFALLVAASSVTFRIEASFPQSLPLGPASALGLLLLALGAAGTLASTRVTTFLTALALARGAFSFLALAGGAQGRAPALLLLSASGVSLLLLAAALEGIETLDDVSKLSSLPRRQVLTLGALAAGSFPPFPGFFALLPLSSAISERGGRGSLGIAAFLLFLLALGSMRVVFRAWQTGGERTVPERIGMAAIGLALAAALGFSIAAAPLVEWARAAALSVL